MEGTLPWALASSVVMHKAMESQASYTDICLNICFHSSYSGEAYKSLHCKQLTLFWNSDCENREYQAELEWSGIPISEGSTMTVFLVHKGPLLWSFWWWRASPRKVSILPTAPIVLSHIVYLLNRGCKVRAGLIIKAVGGTPNEWQQQAVGVVEHAGTATTGGNCCNWMLLPTSPDIQAGIFLAVVQNTYMHQFWNKQDALNV